MKRFVNLSCYLMPNLWLIISLFSIGCGMSKKDDSPGINPNDSKLSTISIGLPDKSKIPAKDEKVKDKLNAFRLVIEPVKSGCNGAMIIDRTSKWENSSLDQKIKKGCDYYIGLQLGNLSSASSGAKELSSIYFTNMIGSQKGDVLKATNEDKVNMTLKLSVTDQGKEAGFISGSTTTTESTDLIIDVAVDNTGTTSGGELFVYKASAQEGVEQPVNWYHKSHGIEVTASGNKRSYDYADLWLAHELTISFRELVSIFKIKKIDHLGIYNYRTIAGSDQLSRHSYALAIDLSSFILEDGTVLKVSKENWDRSGIGDTLKTIRNHFCKNFHTVLSPDYNSDHYDHFHVDLSPSKRPQNYQLLGSKTWNDLSSTPTAGISLTSMLSWRSAEVQGLSEEGDEGLSLRKKAASGELWLTDSYAGTCK